MSGVDIIAFLREFEDLFESLGGHPMAAGFTIRRERLGELEKKILMLVDDFILDEHLQPTLDIDVEVPLDLVDVGFIEKLEQLKPFGVGNRAPVFASRDVKVTDFNVVGRDKTHLSIKFMHEGKPFRGIFFGRAFYADSLEVGAGVDIAYSVEKNEYNNRTYVNLVIKDLKTL
jgi:single-stranded-DNA-specific exonuclease